MAGMMMEARPLFFLSFPICIGGENDDDEGGEKNSEILIQNHWTRTMKINLHPSEMDVKSSVAFIEVVISLFFCSCAQFTQSLDFTFSAFFLSIPTSAGGGLWGILKIEKAHTGRMMGMMCERIRDELVKFFIPFFLLSVSCVRGRSEKKKSTCSHFTIPATLTMRHGHDSDSHDSGRKHVAHLKCPWNS